jgi:Uma2 family endonuclease
MSSSTTNPGAAPAIITGDSRQTIPCLEALDELTSEPGERVLIRGVDWEFYERLVDSIPEGCHIRINYDGKDIELMSPSLLHDDRKGLLGQFVEAVAQELEIPYKSAGQTTWKRPELNRGLESDESYFFLPEKLDALARGRARRSSKITDYPNPDLGIEVDRSASKIDRAGIYAALRVAEVWRFDVEREQVIIERLGEDGIDHPVQESGFLPIRSEEIYRWVALEDSRDESAWARRLRAWVRSELAPRRPR